MRCPQSSIYYDERRGELICTETGEVLQDRLIDYGPEWRYFDAGTRSRSCLAPLKGRRTGVREVFEAVIAGANAFSVRADVTPRTIEKIYNVLTSVTQLPNLRWSGLDWVTATIYASLTALGYYEEVIHAALRGEGRLTPLVKDLKKSLLNTKVQAIFREVRSVGNLPEHEAVRSSRGALLITASSVNSFSRIIGSVSGRLAGVNVFTRLPRRIRVSLPAAARLFGVTQRYDGRVVVRESSTTLIIRPTAVNIYGPPLQPETLIRIYIPKVFWAATEV